MNEAENLPHVLPVVATLVDEVVLVDGRSTDDTVQVARDLIPRIRIVPQAGEGKGDALRRGFEAASGDIIVMLDADGSTDPHEIPMFVGALLAGADFAKGTRFMQGAGSADMTSIRNLGNRTFVLMVRLLFGGRYSDLCYGYNAFWADVLPELGLNSDGFEIETAMNVPGAPCRATGGRGRQLRTGADPRGEQSTGDSRWMARAPHDHGRAYGAPPEGHARARTPADASEQDADRAPGRTQRRPSSGSQDRVDQRSLHLGPQRLGFHRHGRGNGRRIEHPVGAPRVVRDLYPSTERDRCGVRGLDRPIKLAAVEAG